MEVLRAHCAGLDLHKDSVVACVRHMVDGKVTTGVKTFRSTTQELAVGGKHHAYRHSLRFTLHLTWSLRDILES